MLYGGYYELMKLKYVHVYVHWWHEISGGVTVKSSISKVHEELWWLSTIQMCNDAMVLYKTDIEGLFIES